MKDLMSEEHYDHNIHASLTKRSAYHPFPSIGNPLYRSTPHSHENLDPTLSMVFTNLKPL